MPTMKILLIMVHAYISLAGECPGTLFPMILSAHKSFFILTYVITTCGPPYIGPFSLSHCHMHEFYEP